MTNSELTEAMMKRIKRVELGVLPHSGYIPDKQKDRVANVFGFSKATLGNYRRGDYCHKKMRLYAVLMALPPSLLMELKEL